MAFVNMFNDRVEQFNLREENERLAELFSDEKLQEEAQWQAYSVKEISRLFSISEEEALKLMNCGLFKTYRVGNEYRASKKSVEENKKIVKAVLTYQDKKTMSVPDVMRILGLGKTATYRLINQCRFKTYLVLGKMRVDVDSLRNSSTTQKVSKMRKKVKLLQCPSLKLRLNSLTQWQRFKKGAKLKKKSLLKTVQTKTLPCSQNCYQIRIQQHY